MSSYCTMIIRKALFVVLIKIKRDSTVGNNQFPSNLSDKTQLKCISQPHKICFTSRRLQVAVLHGVAQGSRLL